MNPHSIRQLKPSLPLPGMTLTHYSRRDSKTDKVTTMKFDRDHAREIGADYWEGLGLHEMTALRLVNKWNRQTTRWVYFVEA